MPKTLLLADDSVTIQKVVGISFASEDVEIITVDNGDDALRRARELRPDVILADVVMPGLSGYEVCEAVNADAALRHIPVLLLTGTFEAFDEARAASAGAAGHVAKPFEAQTLVDRVKQLLASPPRARAAPAPGPAPSPAAADAGADTFDFFSDSDGAEGDALADESLDLDEADAPFAFGDEDLASEVQEPFHAAPLEPARAATVAILPDASVSSAVDAPEALDFSFDDESPDPLDAPMSPDDLAHTTVLDPAAGADLDVSSSDLAVEPEREAGVFGTDPSATADAPDPDELTEPEPLDDPVSMRPLPRDPVFDMLSRAPSDPPARPYGAQPEPEYTADPGDTVPRRAQPTASSLPDFFEEEPLQAEAIDDDALDAPPMDAEPIGGRSPAPELSGRDRASAAASAWNAPSPAMRDELRDTLEKIAWDAFGPVTEKVVQEAIARIERVAWEVVPKLAETLIQEEIRRLQRGDAEE